MNASDAKKIPITQFLGVNSDKVEVWINSPFNPDEKTPSFKIHTEKNRWYDHAQGIGGNILDLVMALNRCDFSEALRLLSNGDFSFSQANHPVQPKKSVKSEPDDFEILSVKPLLKAPLVEYVKSRKLDLDIAKRYLQEIEYKRKGKTFFSIAFSSDRDGYETRNAYFKGCIGTKSITTIKGNGESLSIFEGFFDFLSALTYYKLDSFKGDVIVLNSTALKGELDELLYSDVYSKIYLFLDNDKTGNKAKQHFYSINQKCVDCSNIYSNFSDFNEFLQNK